MTHLASTFLIAAALASPTATPPDPLVGHRAPDFTLPSDRGGTVHLAAATAHGPVVLAFFPKAFTPV